VLQLAKLDHAVHIIRGGRISDSYVVNAAVKARLVYRLRNKYRQYVSTFGDSPLDLEMMQEADQAIVVVDDIESRSRSVDESLAQALKTTQLRARQALLPAL
jgi:soluble P-type ATPase